MSEELFYQNQLQNLEEIKSTYFSQLDEVEKKRSEIALKKEAIKADQSLIMEEYHKIREAKKLIAQEYEKLIVNNDELKQAKNEYEKKRVSFLKLESELLSRMDRYEINTNSLRKRKSEQYRVMRTQLEEELALNKRQKRLTRVKSKLDVKAKDVAVQLKELELNEIDIDVHTEKIERKREYVKHLQETLSQKESEFKTRQQELSSLMQKTEDEIGRHMTIHKQQINVIRKDARIEQQLAYIKTLEDDLFELRNKMDSTSTELSRLKICSRILDQNLAILAN